MKNILHISLIVAAAILASCSMTVVEYEAAGDIGFAPATSNLTKTAAINGEAYSMDLNLFVFAESVGNTSDEPDYIDNGEFEWKYTYGDWAGKDESYPWPNTFNLHFAGYSKSCNVAEADVDYSFRSDILTINGYEQDNSIGWYVDDKTGLNEPLPGANDLMYFPSTATVKPAGYKKTENNGVVQVTMLHTCSWISFIVKGDDVSTGIVGSKYKIDKITITDIYKKGNVTCEGTNTTVTWSFKDENNHPYPTESEAVLTSQKSLDNSAATPVVAEDIPNNTVVLPQTPGKLELVYSDGAAEYRREGETALDLKINEDPNLNKWEPGKHYTYTITIKANTIQIEPSPVNWTSGDWGVTVE